MTVKELIQYLIGFNDDLEVFVQDDPQPCFASVEYVPETDSEVAHLLIKKV